MRIRLVVWILVVLAAPGAYSAQYRSRAINFCGPPKPSEKPRYTLRIALPKSRTRASSQVKMKLTVTNIATCDILIPTFRLEGSHSRFRITVRDQQGRHVTPIKEGQPGVKFEELPLGSERAVALGAGETYETELDITKLFPPGQVGTYSIQAKELYERPDTWVKSNSITITVTP
jgi:hypothetical protein